MPTFGAPEVIAKRHKRADFDCGDPTLNDYLARYARQATVDGDAVTYVVCDDDHRVLGFYTLTLAVVEHEDAPSGVGRSTPGHRPIPVIHIGRLAVDLGVAGQGLGSALLKDALRRAERAAAVAGGAAVTVHAKTDEAAGWYEHFDFRRSPTDPMHLFISIRDLRRTMQEAGLPTSEDV